MIPIKIDSTPLFENIPSFTQGDMDALIDFTVKEVASNFANLWEKEAESKLRSSRDQYIRSIVVNDLGHAKASVDLVGQLPNMIESGAESFDMKVGLLKGKNSKLTKNGIRFNTVPFYIGTPGTLSENFSMELPKEVYEIILKKPQYIPIVGGMASQLTFEDLPEKYIVKESRMVQHPVSKAWAHYTHKSSKYEGVQRQRSNVTRQNTYVSFRRVSENSDPFSWIHPGMQASNLADAALNELRIDFIVGRSIDEFLNRNGFL